MTARVYNNILLQLDLIENKIQSGHVSNNLGYNMIQAKSPWNRAQIDNLQSTALCGHAGFALLNNSNDRESDERQSGEDVGSFEKITCYELMLYKSKYQLVDERLVLDTRIGNLNDGNRQNDEELF